jgi:3-isopropylmalate dehydratase small subunit
MNLSNIRGKAHKYGDNINTDIITPGKYMELSIKEMAKHAMEGVDPISPPKRSRATFSWRKTISDRAPAAKRRRSP